MLRTFLWLCLAMSVCARADADEFGPSQRRAFTDSEVQADAGRRYAAILADLARHSELDTDRELLARAKHVMNILVATAVTFKPASARWPWEIHVTNSPQYDGFCMAGGKLLLGAQFVHKLRLTDAELAMVLAHEVAHALAEHQGEELSSARKLLPAKYPRALDDVVSAMKFDYGLQIKLAALSRQQELEADRLGLILASRAGWPPASLVVFFEKLAGSEERENNDITYPPADVRLKRAQVTAAVLER